MDGVNESDAIPEAVAAKLAEHAASIVRFAVVAPRDRDDLVEELTGHLEAAYRAARADGRGEEDAVEAAIAAFGATDVVARELMVTYRGRLWASTIGQLLRVVIRSDEPPAPINWLVRFDRVIAVLSVVAAVVFGLTGSPTPALVGSTMGIGAAVIMWLAATGLRGGRSWAARVSAYVCAVNAAIFFVVLAPPGGGVTISLNGLSGLVLLLTLAAQLTPIGAWVAGSRPISRPLGATVGVVLVAWTVMILTDGAIPDPTQIGPSDIHAVALVTCPDPATPAGRDPAQGVARTLDLRITYDRADWSPRGLLRDNLSWGDVIELDVGSAFASLGDVRAAGIDAAGTTQQVNVSMWTDIPAEVSGMGDEPHIVAEILGADQRAGRTIRVIVPTFATVGADDLANVADVADAPEDGIVATIRIHHLDRFTLEGFASCDQPVTLEARD